MSGSSSDACAAAHEHVDHALVVAQQWERCPGIAAGLRCDGTRLRVHVAHAPDDPDDPRGEGRTLLVLHGGGADAPFVVVYACTDAWPPAARARCFLGKPPPRVMSHIEKHIAGGTPIGTEDVVTDVVPPRGGTRVLFAGRMLVTQRCMGAGREDPACTNTVLVLYDMAADDPVPILLDLECAVAEVEDILLVWYARDEAHLAVRPRGQLVRTARVRFDGGRTAALLAPSEPVHTPWRGLVPCPRHSVSWHAYDTDAPCTLARVSFAYNAADPGGPPVLCIRFPGGDGGAPDATYYVQQRDVELTWEHAAGDSQRDSLFEALAKDLHPEAAGVLHVAHTAAWHGRAGPDAYHIGALATVNGHAVHLFVTVPYGSGDGDATAAASRDGVRATVVRCERERDSKYQHFANGAAVHIAHGPVDGTSAPTFFLLHDRDASSRHLAAPLHDKHYHWMLDTDAVATLRDGARHANLQHVSTVHGLRFEWSDENLAIFRLARDKPIPDKTLARAARREPVHRLLKNHVPK